MITGSDLFAPIAKEHNIPFAVAGFEGEQILVALYALVKLITAHQGRVMNMYPAVVTPEGNITRAKIDSEIFRARRCGMEGHGSDTGLGNDAQARVRRV